MSRKMVAAVIADSGKVLLVKNIKHGQVRLEPPGGKVLSGEGVEPALVREVKEELGIDIKPITLMGVFPTMSPEGSFDVYMFLSKIVDGKPVIPESEKNKLGGFEWLTLEEIKGNSLIVPNLKASLDELKKFL